MDFLIPLLAGIIVFLVALILVIARYFYTEIRVIRYDIYVATLAMTNIVSMVESQTMKDESPPENKANQHLYS